MDYTKIARSLLYRERKGLEEFIQDNDLNAIIVENMQEINVLMINDFEQRALTCLNAAYYICTLILLEKFPAWRLPFIRDYPRGLERKHAQEYKSIVLTLVYILLTHYTDEEWQLRNEKFLHTMKDEVVDGRLHVRVINVNSRKNINSKQDINFIYYDLTRGTDQEIALSPDEFAPRNIIEIMDECLFMPHSDLPFIFAKDIDYVIPAIFNTCPEETKKIALYSAKDIVEDILSPIYDESIQPKPDIPEYVYDAIDKLKWTFTKYGMSWEGKYENLSGNEDSNDNSATNASPQIKEMADCAKKLEKENDELKKRQESSHTQIEQLNKELDHYKALYDAAESRAKRYEEELGTVEEIDWKEQLNIKERIIFFQALTGCALNEGDRSHGNQTQKALLIARLSGGSHIKIRSVINTMSREIENVENGGQKEFSEGTRNAALNVYNFLHKAVKGDTIGSKPHRCKTAMEFIKQTYHLKINPATPPPRDNNFLIESEPQEEN